MGNNKDKLFKTSRLNWNKFKFNQIADKISENVDPRDTDLNDYIGLEHIESENIHIKNFGKPSDVIGGKLKCYPGDVIFGKRRAYLRKAALVKKKAICSAHSFVLRSNPQIIEKKLFPFFLHSDSFMHKAINISLGGLSPTINWKHLKELEFILPPIEKQKFYSELLCAVDDVVLKNKQLLFEIENLYSAYSVKIFKNKEITKLTDVADIISGSYGKASGEVNGKVIGVSNIKENGIINYDKFYSRFFTKKEFSKFKLKKGDLIMVKSSGNSDNIISGRISIYDEPDENYIASNFLFLIRSKKIDSLKLFHSINSIITQNFIKKLAVGSTYPNLTLSDIELVNIYIPNNSELKKLNNIFLQRKEILSKVRESQKLQKDIINKIFYDI